MELWTEIRRKVLVEKVPKREICRDYKVGWRTLEKILEHPEPPGYRSREGSRWQAPAQGPYLAVIDEILAQDADPSTPRKQRHTAKRIFERLRDEHHYGGQRVPGPPLPGPQATPLCRRSSCPLSHPPGARPVRLRRGDRRDRGRAPKGRTRGHDASLLGRLLRLGLPPRVHRDLPTGPRPSVQVLRRRPHFVRLRQHLDRGLQGHGSRRARADARVPAPGEPLPLRAPVLPGRPGATRRASSRASSGTVVATSSSRCRRFNSFAELNEHLAAPCASTTCSAACAARPRPRRSASRSTAPRCSRRRRRSRPPARRAAQGQFLVLGALRPQRLSVPTNYAHHDLSVVGGIDHGPHRVS